MLSLSCKFQYWTLEVEHYYYYNCFPLFNEFQQESEVEWGAETRDEIKDHLNSLSESLTEYIPY